MYMKRYFIPLVIGMMTLSCGSSAKPESGPEPEKDPDPISEVTIPAPAGSPLSARESLTAEEVQTYKTALSEAWKSAVKSAYEESFKAGKIIIGNKKMPVWWTTYGSTPAGGRSLVISLHGGGGAPASLNDSQWENQKKLYQPKDAVYLCPRAIQDTWDLHFVNEADAFYDAIIRYAVSALNVNPDKVYIMGYSAGGDGVWRLGPRMADHWAAASMMAGHPGDVRLESLRNTPFSIWCGALDKAYDRNKECAARIAQMDALQAADPEGYIHDGHIVDGKPHWMDGVDRAAVPWMQNFTRNPYPNKVVWVQGDAMKSYFYWLGIPRNEAKKGKMVVAHIQDNTVTIEKSDYSRLSIYLNDTLADLDKPVKVVSGDKVLFEGMVQRTPQNMLFTLNERGDLSYIFPAIVEVKL